MCNSFYYVLVILLIVIIALFVIDMLSGYSVSKSIVGSFSAILGGGIIGGASDDDSIVGSGSKKLGDILHDYVKDPVLSNDDIKQLGEIYDESPLPESKLNNPKQLGPLLKKKSTTVHVYEKLVPAVILHSHVIKSIPNRLTLEFLKKSKLSLKLLADSKTTEDINDLYRSDIKELIDLIDLRIDYIKKDDLRSIPTSNFELATKMLIIEMGNCPTSSPSNIRQCEQEKDALRSRMTRIEDEKDDLRRRALSLRDEIDRLRSNLATAPNTNTIIDLRRRIDLLENENNNLRNRLSTGGPVDCTIYMQSITKLQNDLVECQSTLRDVLNQV